ncbi:hypothetical protein FPV67DRAFT_1453788 [Lyophyllum atratum]|nr:hypothetical protein FPV67DRAFT_1453788 [Lyophyllum atratum]
MTAKQETAAFETDAKSFGLKDAGECCSQVLDSIRRCLKPRSPAGTQRGRRVLYSVGMTRDLLSSDQTVEKGRLREMMLSVVLETGTNPEHSKNEWDVMRQNNCFRRYILTRTLEKTDIEMDGVESSRRSAEMKRVRTFILPDTRNTGTRSKQVNAMTLTDKGGYAAVAMKEDGERLRRGESTSLEDHGRRSTESGLRSKNTVGEQKIICKVAASAEVIISMQFDER